MAVRASSRARVRFAAAVLTAVCSFPAVGRAASPEPDRVSLREETITWSTVKYATDAEDGFISGSLDKKTIVDRAFRARVLENRYLKVTLLPEFGGRILSIIYKPTGHEQLYRIEVGVPYGIKAGAFYYDWLMVYGGIFPTFPNAEHGKTWLKPWDFKVVKESAGEVTVSMSLKDNFRGTEQVRGLNGLRGHLLRHAQSRSRRPRCACGAEKSATQDDPIRVLDLHDARAGIGREKPQGDRRRRDHRADPGLQHARLVDQPVRWRRELGSGQEPLRKAALLQELADDGHRVRCARYGGCEFLGCDQPRQRRGDHPRCRQYGHAGPENVDVGISVIYERNRPAQGPERSAALHRIVGGRVGPVFPQCSVSSTRRSVFSGNLQPDRRHEQRDAGEREHPDQPRGRGCERESSVLQYRTGHAVARNIETRRRGFVQRRGESRPEKRQSHFRDDPGRRHGRTGTADDHGRGR
ncbi:MAG: DUF5107 domain-containing protein [Alphaproteobacteria bacterium]|nr:MAG: DUF5107 domain-containing protein [Alphaproteobacteria bacterium]